MITLDTNSSSVNLRASQIVRIQTMATCDMWYIDKGFLVWIIPLTYQSRESIIWACTTSFVHITCLIYLSHVYVYLCFLYRFPCMFSDSVLLIYMYLLDLGFTIFSLCYLSLPVPVCLDHTAWSCTRVTAWYARHLALSYILAGLHRQPWILMSRSKSPDHGGLAVTDQSAQRILPWRSGVQQKLGHHRSSSSQLSSW